MSHYASYQQANEMVEWYDFKPIIKSGGQNNSNNESLYIGDTENRKPTKQQQGNAMRKTQPAVVGAFNGSELK